MRHIDKQSYWARWADLTVCHARTILVVVCLITLGLAYCLFRIEVSSNLRDFHHKEALDLINTIEEDFDVGGGTGDIIFEAQTDESLFSPPLLFQQFRIIEEIKKEYKFDSFGLVESLDRGLKRNFDMSLYDLDDYSLIGQALLAYSGPATLLDLEKATRFLISPHDVITYYQDWRMSDFIGTPPILSPYGRPELQFKIPFIEGIRSYLYLDPKYPVEDRPAIFADIRSIADSYSTDKVKSHIYSLDLASYDIDIQARQNTGLMVLILLLVDGLLLWGIFRRRRELWIALFILTTACIWTFGLASLWGIKLTFLHLIVLPILLGTGIDDAVVFGRRFTIESRTQPDVPAALRSTFTATGKAMFLTTFTTFLAFLCSAVASNSEAISSFCLLVSISMMVVFLLTILLEGALRTQLAVREDEPAEDSTGRLQRIIDTLLGGLSRIAVSKLQARRTILAITAGLFVVAVASSVWLDSEFENRIFLRKGMPSYVADQAVEKHFGRNTVGYILFEGDVVQAELLVKLRKLTEQMGDYPLVETIFDVANVESVIDLIDRMEKVVLPGMGAEEVRKIYDEITTSKETANWVTDENFRDLAKHRIHKGENDYDGLLVTFYFKDAESDEVLEMADRIKEGIHQLGLDQIPGVTIRIGGGGLGAYLEASRYFTEFAQSFLLSLMINWIVLLLFWRRFRQSVVAMLPLFVAVGLTLGVMVLFGVKLNILNLCIGAIAVGLGIDYPIHIIERFEEARCNEKMGKSKAARTTLSIMGPNLMVSALTTIVGFGAACVLAMPIAETFGLLAALAIFLVYLASIFVLPVWLIGRSQET